MDFRLKIFLSVADNLSFTKASKELYISQPAISKNIRELENTYNVQLFERSRNGITLTPHGVLLQHHAKRIVRAYESLKCEMELAAAVKGGNITVGATPVAAAFISSDILPDFLSGFPEVRLSLVVNSKEQLYNMLEDCTIDVAFTEENLRSPKRKAETTCILVENFIRYVQLHMADED